MYHPLNISIDHAVRVPTNEAQQSGLALDQVQIKEEYGGGYPAHVEGLHHLHCLVCPIKHALTANTHSDLELVAQIPSLEHRLLSQAKPGAFLQRRKYPKTPHQ